MFERMPPKIERRLNGARDGILPWIATLTPAELLVSRSHGLRPIASVSATCWMHYGYSWTLGHTEGWQTALRRLKGEAIAAGANAVVDVKMRTVPLDVAESMDFTLVGTAVRVDGLPPSGDPVVATVSALEFVRLLDADVVPTGIAVGADYQFWIDYQARTTRLFWLGNVETPDLSALYDGVRRKAHAELRRTASHLGNGALAHVNFGQMFRLETQENAPPRYLARHIAVATVIDRGKRSLPLPDVSVVMDLRAGESPLERHRRHHQSYASNEEEGAI